LNQYIKRCRLFYAIYSQEIDMPKDSRGRREVTAAERTEIIRLAVDEGLAPPQIREKVPRDTRTIKGVLDRHRKIQATREGMVELVRQAMRAHHDDLLNMARDMKVSLVLPSGLLDQPRDPAAGLSDDPLYAGFTEHLHLSSLWQDLAAWNNASARWQRLGMTLWDGFCSGLVTESGMPFSATEEKDEIASEELPPCWLSGLQTLIADSAMRLVRGEPLPWPPETPYCRVVPRTGQFRISIGLQGIAQIPRQEPAKTLASLARAWEQLTGSKELHELSDDTLPMLVRARARATGALDTLILKRVFGGHCRYCPG
jgi:hypothetical protein